MLVARAPVRITLGGEGTDIPAYYEKHGGVVVNATINYYVYTILTPNDSSEVRIISTDQRPSLGKSLQEDLIWNSDSSLPRSITDYFKVCGGITVFLAPQIPSGTGVGISGSVAVSMIKALAFWVGLDLNPTEVAELSCHIEIERLGMPVGKQDQYAAALGGLNVMTFSKHAVAVTPLKISQHAQAMLNERLMLFFTGFSKDGPNILSEQIAACEASDAEVINRLGMMKSLALDIRSALERGDLPAFGELLHASWLQKRELTPRITHDFLDTCYETARFHGAVGGSIIGAGGGGFLLLYCPLAQQGAVTDALALLGVHRYPFELEENGVQIHQTYSWSSGQVTRAQVLTPMAFRA
ncbi:MAG: GHMP kinase [Anaerolineae bacterium]|nr:GHMP kinase [Anaerolineae bacterium]